MTQVILATDKPDVDTRLNKLESAMKKWADENDIPMEASRGYARFEENTGIGIKELAKMADERMYEEKSEYYRATGRDRRR